MKYLYITYYNLFHNDCICCKYGWCGVTWKIRAGKNDWYLKAKSPFLNARYVRPKLTAEFIRVNQPIPLNKSSKQILDLVIKRAEGEQS